MGGCLQRENQKQIHLHNQSTLIQNNFKLKTIPIQDLKDFIENYQDDNYELFQIVQENENDILIVQRESPSPGTYAFVSFQGKKNYNYIKFHEFISKGENQLIGACYQNKIKTILIVVKKITGLIAQIEIQELQTLIDFEDLPNAIQNRFNDRYMFCGFLMMKNRIIVVFRKFYNLQLQRPSIQRIELSMLNNIVLIYQGVLYQVN